MGALWAHLISLREAQEALPPGPPLSPEGRGAIHFALGTLLLRLLAPPARQGVRCSLRLQPLLLDWLLGLLEHTLVQRISAPSGFFGFCL